MGVVILLVINFSLIYFFTGAVYPIFGLCFTMISIIVSIVARDKKYCRKIISKFIRNWNLDGIEDEKDQNIILLSIAFLIEAIKVGAAIGIFVEVSAILLLALCILLASGFIIEGYSSGMTIGFAYNIAKIAVKVYQFFNSLTDRLMGFIVKVEFSALGIKEA